MPVKVFIEKKGRKGKTVTMVTGIPHNPQVIERMARELKKKCGAGGTSYQKTIEIQGEHLEVVNKYLEEEGLL